ncbi:FAD-binding domain containing protein [Parasponia andersonii]|uniref:FAD-binding domain containing protein n=1 Tax=Parasponia andersonii TaxID=3476 RepID=A0A2P5CUR3_PARAD|nr:FAD-binding domain containing protein [Parasponia andersonii]
MGVFRFFKSFHGQRSGKSRIKAFPLGCIQSRSLSSSKLFNNGEDTVLPVLIVGAGPVGLVLSILLTKLGVKCAVLEKSKSFSEHPQAHFINNRSMEVFCKLDGLAEEIQRSQPPVEFWRKFIYCTSLSGSILGSVDHMEPQDFEQVVSPVSVAHFSQYKLMRLLLKQLENLNFQVFKSEELEGRNHGILRERQILMGHECLCVDANNDYLTVTASIVRDGKFMERNIRCNILVGADGAGSTVRKLVGIDMKGERELQNLVSVHFLSKELGQYLLNERPGMLFFIFNTEAIGVLVAHDLMEGEFVFQIPFYPPQQNIQDFSTEMCEELIFKLVGRELRDLAVIDIKPWIMHAEVAEKFICRDNRIILAGDAAHRFPPAGGFGMNTGIQDSHNLAWKIASVAKGIAPFSILNTYETERRPIAIFNTELSIQNFKAAMTVPAALGLDPTVAKSVHQVVNEVGAVLPSGLQKAILDGIFAVGRAQLSEFLLNEKNPIGSSRLAKLRQIFDEGKSLQLQFPAEDLGFRYLVGALVPDSDCVLGTPEAPTGSRRDYIPTADSGCRLPHMNVRVLSNSSSKEIISTLDLISGDKVEFLLVIAPIESSYVLARTALEVSEEFNVSIRICVLWSAGTPLGVVGSKALLAPWENYIDVIEVKKSPTSLSWWDICKMTDKGAILVRPDDHIAWRVKSGLVGDPVKEMKRVFSAVLGVNSTCI